MISDKIKIVADSIGIDIIGFAKATEFENYALQNTKRRDPKLTLPNAKSIIVIGIYIGGFTLPIWEDKMYGRTSRLYLSEYFLDVIKPLEPIIKLLKDEGYKAIACESISSEKSILPLKLAAIRAGFGWQGKHTLIISKKFGTYLALGGIITDAELYYNDNEEKNRCNNCDICQKKCPVGALEKKYQLNKEKCISFILQNEIIPYELKEIIGNRVGDCEICQDNCPWNKKHIEKPIETKFTTIFEKRKKEFEKLFYLPDLKNINEEEYIEKFGFLKTDISYEIFLRNVKVAYNNAINHENNNKTNYS